MLTQGVAALAAMTTVFVAPSRAVHFKEPLSEVAAEGRTAVVLRSDGFYPDLPVAWFGDGHRKVLSIFCDTQTYAPVLAGARAAAVCYEETNQLFEHDLDVVGTLDARNDAVALITNGNYPITVAGRGQLIAAASHRRLWVIAGKTPHLLRRFTKSVSVLDTDGKNLLLDADGALLVTGSSGQTLETLPAHDRGGARFSGTHVVAIDGDRLYVDGAATYRVPAKASIQSATDALVVYTVGAKLHLLRLADGHDIVLRVPFEQKSVQAALTVDGLFYASGKTLAFIPAARLAHALQH